MRAWPGLRDKSPATEGRRRERKSGRKFPRRRSGHGRRRNAESPSIAATRFGLGAWPGEIGGAERRPRRAGRRRFGRTADQLAGDFESSVQRVTDLRMLQQDRLVARMDDAPVDPVKEAQKMIRQARGRRVPRSAALASQTDAAFRERALFCSTTSRSGKNSACWPGRSSARPSGRTCSAASEEMLVASTLAPGGC